MANILLERAKDVWDKVKACEVKIQILISKNQLLEAIQIGLKFLAFLGIYLPEKPDENDVKREEDEIKQKLSCKQIESLIYLPIMREKKQLASMRILSSLLNAAYLGLPKLLPLIVAKQVDLSITYGNMDVSPSAYANHALILCSNVDNIDLGYSLGNLALD
ncbi:MAG: hypothetical protein F6K24_50140, partial [Okeania sp. SIO2D1]|nr:hypothetical protein [Okeania sp. SIO2D1]